MQQLKKLTSPKNNQKFDNKIPGRQYLLGRFYDATASALVSPACKGKHHNIKKFPKSKTRRLLDLQMKIYDKIKINVRGKSLQELPVSVPPTPSSKTPKNIPQNQSHNYTFYQPLHNLWLHYIRDLIEKQYFLIKIFRKSQQSKQLKILRADFHGAYVTVIDSCNPTLVGIQGIVVKETLRTFQIIVREPSYIDKKKYQRGDMEQQGIRQIYNNKNGKDGQRRNIKVVVKSICVFMLQVGTNILADKEQTNKQGDSDILSNNNKFATFIINGSNLVFRPSDRIKHKYKFKKADQLSHRIISLLSEVRTENSLEEKQNNQEENLLDKLQDSKMDDQL